jgi:DNA invertase Pin-like site-specific DNA recombinase
MSECVLAKYIRLSSEDLDTGEGGKDESNSVVNQRNLLDDFISRTPDFIGCEILEFCDDGWSGTNFNRPRVQELLKLAEAGKIHCIVVKDLSRFGRSHIEVGDYLEQILPNWGVRFISVNDAFDSNKYRGITGGIDIAFRNLIYDLYSRDLSEKVRSARITQAKRGEFTSPYGFYGYIKDKADKHRLVIDEEAAQIVRTVFDWADQGHSTTEIARKLNDGKVPTPQMRKKALGVNRRWHMSRDSNFWDGKRIYMILCDERYTGKLVACKHRRYEVGKVQAELLPASEWIVVPGVIPAIVSHEQFARVRENLRRGYDVSTQTKGREALFYHKIKCGHCKRAMYRGNTTGKTPSSFCGSKSYIHGLSCMDGTIPEREVVEIVLCAIRQQAAFADRARTWMEKKAKAMLPDMEAFRVRVAELEIAIKKATVANNGLWESLQDGHLTREEFTEASDRYLSLIAGYEESIRDYEAGISRMKAESGRENLFAERFAKHTGIQKLTRGIVDELVSAIHIYDRDRIEIVFNYMDEYAALLEKMGGANLQEDDYGKV